jgi:hypothetical protein
MMKIITMRTVNGRKRKDFLYKKLQIRNMLLIFIAIDFDRPFVIQGDASAKGVGGACLQ